MRKRVISVVCSLLLIFAALSSCTTRPEPAASSPAPSASAAATARPTALPSPPPAQTPEPTSDPAELARAAELEKKQTEAIAQADALAAQYFYDEALATLSEPELAGEAVAAKQLELQAAQSALVNYEGDIKHIFFHSLIVFPEMIFKDKSTPMGGYNSGFCEKAELLKILPQLYERGYVLYDLNECFEKVDGVMRRKEIMLPPGKQPLILSVDDVAYDYGRGYSQRLFIKDDGSLCNIVRDPSGADVEMPDGDVFGVVDAFVSEHPDFAYRGHKGTLALTGYQGAFGYSYETAEGQADIMKVAEGLRNDGWSFASHSYTHNGENYYGRNSKPENIKYDVDKWVSHVAPYIGSTNLFIAPFGYRVKQPALQYILDDGFDIYCTVSDHVVNELYDDYALMSRIEISGYSMTYYRQLLNDNFFNVDEVFDAAGRPPVI